MKKKATASIILPAIKLTAIADITPSPEEQAKFASAFDEAIALSAMLDRRSALLSERERIESFLCTTPKEKLDKEKALAVINKKLRDLNEPKRLNQRHRLKVREIAAKIWQQHPEKTIQELTTSNKINAATDGRVYTEKTLRNWINSLAPNRSKGRRKSKPQI